MVSSNSTLFRLATLMMAIFVPESASAIEEPKYSVEVKEGSMEIRRYEPRIVAETVVSGPWERASNEAFRRLADYIFGNNTTKKKVAMTAPVGMESTSQKIPMTAPVGMEPAGADSAQPSWRMSFTMPSEFTMETLPKPNSPLVTIREVPGRMVASLRFSGSGREARFREREKKLLDWIAAEGYKVAGPVNYSQYNPPWTPGFLRRNEILIPVTK